MFALFGKSAQEDTCFVMCVAVVCGGWVGGCACGCVGKQKLNYTHTAHNTHESIIHCDAV